MVSKKVPLSEIAVERMMNFAFGVSDPDEILMRMGIQRHQLRALEADDELSQCKGTRVDAVTGTDWHVEPSNSRAGKIIAAILKKHLRGVIEGCMDALFYGYSVQEIIYKKEGSLIVPERIAVKPMEWFKPQPDGRLLYFPTDARYNPNGIECDPRKFIFATNKATYRQPMGEAMFSRAWLPVTWRREGWGLWLSYMETFSQPILIGRVPNYVEFVEAMQAQGIRSAIGWQTSSDRDEITTISSSTPGEFERLEQALIARIQKMVLGQTMTSGPSGSSSGGSYAQAAIGNRVLESKTLSDIVMVNVFVQRLVDTLCEINNLSNVKLVIANQAGLEQPRATRDALLYPVLQASQLKLSKSYFTNAYDYKDEDLEVIEIPEPLEDTGTPGKPGTDETEDDGQAKPATKEDGKPGKGRSVADKSKTGRAA